MCHSRNPDSIVNYPPITLLSCMCKILETMIKARLEWTMQTGFRRELGTQDNINFLTTYIQNAFTHDETVIEIFIDIKSAYNNVNIFTLYKQLKEIEISMELCKIVFRILECRQLYIRDKNYNIHRPRRASIGLTQGSPLSPLLFNIYSSII